MRKRVTWVSIGLHAMLVLTVAQAQANENEPDSHGTAVEHREEEHAFHRNHFGGFMGASTHSDTGDTGFTLGLEYARQFTPRWAVTVVTEQVTSDLERDVILLAGAIFYPLPRIGLVVAPGVEVAKKDAEHDETEFLLRLGASYGFPVGQASLGLALFVDRAAERWTFVYGIVMVTGF